MSVENVLPEVRALGAYTLRATEARVKLNQNESPWDFDPEFKRRVCERVLARSWNRYPDFHPTSLLEGIGALHGVAGAAVLLGNGSNELIQAVLAATVGQGAPVAIPVPTFTLYAMMIAANQGTVRPIPLAADLSYDTSAWLGEAARGEAHLLLCSPNNPTGSVFPRSILRRLAELTPRLVIVDEAYVQFGEDDLSSLLQDCPNLVVLRTFSKAMGLAGVRIGYALARPELAREISKVKLPYNVGVFGLEVVREALANPASFRGVADAIRHERSRLERSLAELPFDAVYPGFANFVLVRTGLARELFDALFLRGILVRDVGAYPMLANCLRITVGAPDENTELIATTREFFLARGLSAAADSARET